MKLDYCLGCEYSDPDLSGCVLVEYGVSKNLIQVLNDEYGTCKLRCSSNIEEVL